MSVSDPFETLRHHLAALCTQRIDTPSERMDFTRELHRLSAQAAVLIAPKNHGLSDIQRRDLLSDLSRFQSDQKVVDWAHSKSIVLSKGVFWWWCGREPNRVAHINGLGESNGATLEGFPRITNGIDVWMERPDGTVFLGHRDSLVWHRLPPSLIAKVAPIEARQPKDRWLPQAKQLDEESIAAFHIRYATIIGKSLSFTTTEELALCIEDYMEKFFSTAF
jgi:hypothetical protein